MNTNEYLTNPLIPKNFYNVKCTNVEVIDGIGLPTIIVQLQVVPLEKYGDAQNKILHVTLRGSANAVQMHERFRETFRVEEDPAEAIGRFGSVLVDAEDFKGKEYGGVHFIRQSEIAKRNVAAMERADRDGEIPWAENDHQVRQGRDPAAAEGSGNHVHDEVLSYVLNAHRPVAIDEMRKVFVEDRGYSLATVGRTSHSRPSCSSCASEN